MKNNRIKQPKPDMSKNGLLNNQEPNKPTRFLTKENIRRRYEHI